MTNVRVIGETEESLQITWNVPEHNGDNVEGYEVKLVPRSSNDAIPVTLMVSNDDEKENGYLKKL